MRSHVWEHEPGAKVLYKRNPAGMLFLNLVVRKKRVFHAKIQIWGKQYIAVIPRRLIHDLAEQDKKYPGRLEKRTKVKWRCRLLDG